MLPPHRDAALTHRGKAGGKNGRTAVMALKDRERALVGRPHPAARPCGRLSGKRIVSGSGDHTLKLWDATGCPGMSDRDDDRNAGYSKNSRKAAT